MKKQIRGKDYIGVGVGAVIINKKGQVLLIRRGPKSKNEVGMWGIPGGAVEYGEGLEDAIKREVREELAIEITPLKILSMVNHIIEKDGQHWVTASFVSQLAKGTPKIQEKGKLDRIKWISIDDIVNLENVSHPALEALLEFKKRFNELSDFF
ncbi:MAG: NUDIX domain-containing protein [Candidatus Levyibacteriota bacterium]